MAAQFGTFSEKFETILRKNYSTAPRAADVRPDDLAFRTPPNETATAPSAVTVRTRPGIAIPHRLACSIRTVGCANTRHKASSPERFNGWQNLSDHWRNRRDRQIDSARVGASRGPRRFGGPEPRTVQRNGGVDPTRHRQFIGGVSRG